MNNFKKISWGVAILSLAFGLAGPIAALAATSPSLGAAASYALLASTYTNTVVGTTINGDVGFTTPPAVAPGGVHPNYASTSPYSTAGTDQGTALTALAAQPCNFVFGSDTDLSLLSQPLAPGVYCVSGAQSIGTGGITLSGAGTYIFRSTGALTSVANSHVVLVNGASSCDVFWTPGAATTLGANSTFAGTDIDDSGITIGSTITWTGRALSFASTVSTNVDTISSACATASLTPPSASLGWTITVIKNVINDNGGTKTASNFSLFVGSTQVSSGVANSFAAPGSYNVTETGDAGYTRSFSGDCDVNGVVNFSTGFNKICIMTNNDIGAPVVPLVPPLIDVVKVPTPLALPAGPGPVSYSYTLRNIGTVPVTNVTMVDDSCSPVNLVSGDTNGDSILDLNETWVYTCNKTLSATHTNTVVATGWANGISATDVANATVVVGVPVVPPLIHVTKIPSPLALAAAGGAVTYTERISNPGTVALSSVTLTDDKCAPMNYISGDTNGDSKLDPSETWVYTCRANLSKTTTNTAVASGVANGMTVRDFAVATVVVAAAVPKLPNTGFAPADSVLTWPVVATSAFLFTSLFYVILKKQKE